MRHLFDPRHRIIVLMVLSCCLSTPSRAQFMLSPLAVTGTDLGSFSTNFAPLGAMVDQSGLKVPFVNASTDFDTYFAPPNTNYSRNADKTKWQSNFSFNLPFEGSVDFDLGTSYNLTKAAIWNVSVKSLTVQIAASTNGPWQLAGQFALSDQQASLSLQATVLDFGASYQGRFVRLGILSEYPTTPQSAFGYVIIGEVVLRAAAIGPTFSIRLQPSGDVTLTFTGTLQSATDINGSFRDVEGSPSGTYTIPNASLSSSQFFRTRN